MGTRKQLIIIGIFAGAAALVAGWILLFQSTLQSTGTDSATQLQADSSKNAPLLDMGTGADQAPKLNKSDAAAKDEPVLASPTLPTNKTPQNYEKIHLIIPSFVSATAFNQLRKDIFTTHRVLADYVEVPKGWKAYEQRIAQELINPEADILLIPTDWVDSFQGTRGLHIPFQADVARFFHPSFINFIDNLQTTFIPFAIDLPITLHQSKQLKGRQEISLAHIQRALLDTEITSDYVPALFGIHTKDAPLLAQQKQAYPEYLHWIFRAFSQAHISQNMYFLNFLLQNKTRDPFSFLKIAQKLTQQHGANCAVYPKLCLIAFQKSLLGFGYSSEMNILSDIFQKKLSTDYFAHNFPDLTTTYTARGWVFVINKKTPRLQEAGERMIGYMQHAEQTSEDLRGYTFSAFNAQRQQQSLPDFLTAYIHSLQLQRGKHGQQRTLFQEKNMLAALESQDSQLLQDIIQERE